MYETGSQVADLHVALAQLFGNEGMQSKMPSLKDTIVRIASHSFPDLANEMGLKMLLPEHLEDELKSEPNEDQVRMGQTLIVYPLDFCCAGSSQAASCI